MSTRGSVKGPSRRPAPPARRSARPARRRAQPPLLRVAVALGRRLEQQRRDLTAVVLLFLAAVGGLGMYGDLAGPAGRAVEWMFRVAVGSVAVALPPLVAWTGMLMLRDREADEPGRVAAGAALTLFGLGGIAHLAGSDLSAGIRLDQMPSLGGVFGALLAWPLDRLLSTWGAGILLACMAGVGLLVTTKTPMRDVGVWGRSTA
ncbi:MAG: DNA translocase FtsK 4TM domain-containing protein, partial [Acidimicrobiales bacterium]